MSQWKWPSGRMIWFLVAGCLVCLWCSTGRGQAPDRNSFEILSEPVLPRDLDFFSGRVVSPPWLSSPASRFRLFGMPTGFPTPPLGLELEEDAPGADPLASSTENQEGGADGRWQAALGMDNPFFDIRRRGDPGGIGFYKLHTQYLFWNSPVAGMSAGLEAVTPAGLEVDGLQNGPTILCPHLAWFYDLGNGTSLQGFVGKHFQANSHWSGGLGRSLQYGLAWQRPCPGFDNEPNHGVHLFVEALGRYRYDSLPSQYSGNILQIVPGVHWQVRENWWLSGGLLVPVGPVRPDSRLWQVTCSWQF